MSFQRLRGTPLRDCRDWWQTHFQTNTATRSLTPGLLCRAEPQLVSTQLNVFATSAVAAWVPSSISQQHTVRQSAWEQLRSQVSLISRTRSLMNVPRFGGTFSGDDDREAINEILRVGTSAGGARAKAILAWNKETSEFRSGQVEAEANFEYWVMKFDGITSSSDTEIATPKGYGKIEYAYHLMAVEAGIEMTTCRLHHEGGRSHFMTKRFDRSANGGKLHMQSLGAIAHYDYRQPASYSYEQAIQVIRRLGLPRKDMDQQALRAIFQCGRSQL